MPRATTGPGDASPTVEVRSLLCPYCGGMAVGGKCASCGGLLEPLSMQATQNEMGPWFIRDTANPFRPGCAYATLCKLAARGRITPDTVLRGPTTRQFWSFARNVRGVAHLLGMCHNCHGPASPDEYMCRGCGAVFDAPKDRQHFGAGAVRLFPGHAPASVVARSVTARDDQSEAAPPTPKRSLGAPAPAPSRAERQIEMVPVSTVRALKRRLEQSRRIVTISVAVNVVLLVILLMTALSNRAPSPAVSNAPAPIVVEETAPTPRDHESITIVASARELAASDDADDWRAAETMLRTMLSDIPDSDRPEEATRLLEAIQRKLSDRSLEEFLPRDE